MAARKYRQSRKSSVVHLEAIDEDFTVPNRRLRASALSSHSFRQVASGLGAANRAMSQLSRVGQQSQIDQARKARDSLEPTFDTLAFDDWMENIVSISCKTHEKNLALTLFSLTLSGARLEQW